MESRQCRVCVWRDSGMREYRADVPMAYDFMEVALNAGITVSIDRNVRKGMLPLSMSVITRDE